MTDERQHEDASPVAEAGPASSDAGVGFGRRLARAREARGLAVVEVARLLNLRTGVVEALEQEAFEQLPGMAFARGYARSYARLVEMSDEEIQAGLATWHDPRDDEALPVSPVRVSASRGLGRILHGHAGLVMTLLSILVAAVVAAVLLLLWPEQEGGVGMTTPDEVVAGGAFPEESPPAPASPEQSDGPPPLRPEPRTEGGAVPAVDLPAHEHPAVAIGEAMNGSVEGGGSEAVAATRQVIPSVLDTPSVLATPAVERTRETFDGGRGIRVIAAGDDRLRLRFTEDCWVEIRDGDDRDVFSDLARGGQRLEIHGKGPFRLLLGYAPGAELVYNGEPVALGPHIRNDVASLVVGR